MGGRVEFDVNERLTTGLEFNWFEEEREGSYRASFHPVGFCSGQVFPYIMSRIIYPIFCSATIGVK